MDGVKDSNFVNFANSVDAIHRKLTTPKKRGVRDDNLGGEAELQANLRKDIVSIMTSPLSQLGKLEPIPGLSAAQVEALRALYASVKNELYRDEGFEAALERAVKLLNPSFTPRRNEEVAKDQDGNGDSIPGPFVPVRRSARLAQLPETSYEEESDDLGYLLDGADNESGGEEGADEDVELDEDGNEGMDGVEMT